MIAARTSPTGTGWELTTMTRDVPPACRSTLTLSTPSTTDLGLTDKNHACSCGTNNHGGAHSDAGEAKTEGTVREHYLIEGMTCSHCVASVTEELSAVDGVESVSVDLQVGEIGRASCRERVSPRV